MMNKKLILVTSGDPSGIGPDICLDLAYLPIPSNQLIVVIGDVAILQSRAQILNKKISFRQVNLIPNFKLNCKNEKRRSLQIVDKEQTRAVEFKSEFGIINQSQIDNLSNKQGELLVFHVECKNQDCIGKLKLENVPYVLKLLDEAIRLCKLNLANKVVTAPISKEIINQYGYKFYGHTEYFADQFGSSKVVMMLANEHMKVALLTTHLPLKEVPHHITAKNLNQTLQIIIDTFINQYKVKNPKIAVCGLNPHAGEGGYMGDEEINVINPVIKNWQNKGYLVSGAYSADTIFNQAKNYDVILAMYHDQGLPVLKYSDFSNGINITLGLPIIRTSVDHGTALTLAGSGRACSKSLIKAIDFVINLDD